MTISVLDRRDEAAEPLLLGVQTLGGLHDVAARTAEELLPCRANDPELWFAESPTDVELAKALCVDCPVRALCLDGALDRPAADRVRPERAHRGRSGRVWTCPPTPRTCNPRNFPTEMFGTKIAAEISRVCGAPTGIDPAGGTARNWKAR